MSVHEHVYIGVSPLGGNGVFVSAEGGLQPNEAITIYPGMYRKILSKPHAAPLKYSVTINSQFFPPLEEHEEWIIDACKLRYSTVDGIGHLINSSHPALPTPYNSNNCILVEEQWEEHVYEHRPPLVFVVTTSIIPMGGELLVDYHWLLNGLTSNITSKLLHCVCDKCSV